MADQQSNEVAPLASLPMYNLPEMQSDNALFWNAIREELRRLGVGCAPPELAFEGRAVPQSIASETIFTQVCGWPFQTIYRGQGVMLGTPVYDVPFCNGPTHTGVFVVQQNSAFQTVSELRGCRFVFNSVHSNSGMNLPRRVIADLAAGRPFFATSQETHSHPGNLERVARGEADATCVDCVTYAFFMRYRPQFQSRLRILAATQSTPSLPFVTSISTPPAIRAALQEALRRVARLAEWRAAREGLMISDIVAPDLEHYSTQLALEAESVALGYPTLI